ncbi:MAG: hypothetical protein FJ125_12645 [Deltaproteobacteria bacterium]|nr:hypothetical protein [Deltaproteobacteria bacterium]
MPERNCSSSFGVRADRALWSWGFNDSGQLGRQAAEQFGLGGVPAGRRHPRSASPCYRRPCSFSLALTAEGELWGWGDGRSGQLGDGTKAGSLGPVPIPGPVGEWAEVDAGEEFAVGVRVDGTLWSWGWNEYGQLGRQAAELPPPDAIGSILRIESRGTEIGRPSVRWTTVGSAARSTGAPTRLCPSESTMRWVGVSSAARAGSPVLERSSPP